MDEVQLRMDSKGRICLPSEMREETGDIVVATRTPKGILIRSSKKKDFLDEFKRIITSEPERTGEPENWTPEQMKDIWESRVCGLVSTQTYYATRSTQPTPNRPRRENCYSSSHQATPWR